MLCAQSVQWCRILITARITANEVERADGHVQFVIVGILEQEKFRIVSVDSEHLKTGVSTHAVF